MEFFGLTIARTKALTLSPVYSGPSWWASIREPFTGAWQKNMECETPRNILAFSAVYACVSLIADDIAKMRIKLMRQVAPELWREISTGSPFLPVLRKPNRYQTRIQFISQWIISKLFNGNTYILLSRDDRGVVTEEYPLDPRLVTTLVASDGSVYYQIKQDALSNVDKAVTVPASEIIHDRMITPWHPLIGVSPIFACGASATQGIRIQANSERFFQNMSRPSGMLTAPGPMTDEKASSIKKMFEGGFGGANMGRLFVGSDGLTYEPMTIPANDAQLIEQLRWTVEDVARCFKVPLHKLGMGQPTLNNIAALNQDYYSQTLQTHIEAIELLEDEALGLPALGYGTELDLDALLRMDPISRADRNEKAIRAGYLAPNEARESENLPPVEGGDSPMIQEQNFSLAAIAKRDALANPWGARGVTPSPAPVQEPEPPSGKDIAKAEIETSELLARCAKEHLRRELCIE